MDLEPVPAASWLTAAPPSAVAAADLTQAALNITSAAAAAAAAAAEAANATAAGGGTFYSVTQTVLMILVTSVLVSVTVVGNIMVMVSFHIDKQLQTISNYFLFSLAVADLAIGLISMPLFTVFQVMGRWVLGPIVCDTWLALDYLASNASVLNLLIISFDRYFSVTRPLTYRARRTNRRAAAMIACAWGISLVLWPPWIYAWPYIEGKRTVEPDECYIQFLQTNHYWTFGTAIAAFYLPVLIMCGLYYRIWLETEQRQRDLTHLQAGKHSSSSHSRRSNTSQAEEPGSERRRTDHSRSSTRDGSTRSTGGRPTMRADKGGSWRRLGAWCGGGRGSDRPRPHSALDLPLATRTSSSAPNGRHHSLRQTHSAAVYSTPTYMCTYGRHTIPSPLPILSGLRRNASAGALTASRCLSADSVYTIVIKLPEPVTPSGDPSITMLSDSSDADGDADAAHQPHCPLSRSPAPATVGGGRRRPAPAPAAAEDDDDDDDSDSSSDELPQPPPPPTARRPSQLPDLRIPLNARVIPKQLARGAPNPKKKKKREEKKQERKAAKTLSAILLAFIITWTPYNVLVLIRVMLKCDDCIPTELWNFSYYLCYINSTVNPLCYALCNASFRRTYVKILTCTWSKKNRHPASRVYYN